MSTPEASGTRYLDPKALDQIKRLDVRARLVVEGFITGQHRSPYNGFAIEFATHREYAPGDDLRHLQPIGVRMHVEATEGIMQR